MSKFAHIALAVLALVTAQAATAQPLTTTGTYDEQTVQTNAVDQFIGSISLTDFQAMVSDAFSNDAGGVIHFDDLASGTILADGDADEPNPDDGVHEAPGIPAGQGFDASFGVSATQTMTIGMGQQTDRPDKPDKSPDIWEGQWIVGDSSGGDRTAISGNNILSGVSDWHFTFSQSLEAVGVTALSRGAGHRQISATLGYDDGTTSLVTIDRPIDASNAGDDLFLGYQAPSGKRITDLLLDVDYGDGSDGGFTSLDDLGFVVNSSLYDPPEPEPRADYAGLADAYSQAMIDQGRDTYGPENSPLFAAQMTRPDYNVPTDPHNTFPAMDAFGLRYDDRSWGSANGHDHVQLYQHLYARSQATGDPQYAQAADAAIQYTFQNLRSANTDLIAWGEEMSWMLHHEAARLPGDGIMDGTYDGKPYDNNLHEPGDRWTPELWDKAFELAPAAARAFAQGLWDHQIADQNTGDFSRHARYTTHAPGTGQSFPRVGSWMMLAWAKAYEHVDGDAAFDAEMVEAIETVAQMYHNRRDPSTNALPAWSAGTAHPNIYWMTNNLTMASDIGHILETNVLPAVTRDTLQTLAADTDQVILNLLDHNLDGHLTDQPIGFHHRAFTDQTENGYLKIGDPRGNRDNHFTEFWTAGYGSPMTSTAALMMLERYEQLGATPNGLAYFDLAIEAADLYLTQDPDTAIALHPIALADAIQLMLKAYELDGDPHYLDRAAYFGDWAAGLFFDETSALPKVTSQHDFYEALSGGDDLMLAMHELGQTIPEPGSCVLFLLGGGLLATRRRRAT